MKTREPDRVRPGQAPLLSEIFSDHHSVIRARVLEMGGCRLVSDLSFQFSLSR